MIDAVTGGGDLTSHLRMVPLSNFGAIAPVVGFLLVFSAVYYAMLIYAPRQVAESEGDLIAARARDGARRGWLVTLGG